MSVPTYIVGILLVQDTLSIMKNYIKLGCFQNQMGESFTWLQIEVWVFWINIMALAFYVLVNKYGSLETTKARHDIWKEFVNKEVQSFYSWKNDSHDKTVECGKDNMVNHSHIWVIDETDIDQIEKSKEQVQILIENKLKQQKFEHLTDKFT
jgi:hypothetical protein